MKNVTRLKEPLHLLHEQAWLDPVEKAVYHIPIRKVGVLEIVKNPNEKRRNQKIIR